jgi:hypothetical protein
MRFGGLSATALGLLVAACADPYSQHVAVQPQRTHTTCAWISDEIEADDPCSSPRLAALSPGVWSARMNAPPSGVGAQVKMSVSNTVPVIDVEQICQGIANQGEATFHDHGIAWAKKECLDTEQEVRDELVKVWGSFDIADRTHCVTETTMGGESSFTELLTCLEMARDVRKIHAEANAARQAQSVGQR